MSDSVMYPEAGRWVNSYLVGANAYKIMSTPEEAQQLLLDDSGDFLQTGTEHHYIQVRCRNENKPLWLVPFRGKREELLRVSESAPADSDGTNPAGGLFLAVRSGSER